MFPKMPDVSNILEFCEPLTHMFQHAIKVCVRPQIMEIDQTPVQKSVLNPWRTTMNSGLPCAPYDMQCRFTVSHWHACRYSGRKHVSVVSREPFDKSSSQSCTHQTTHWQQISIANKKQGALKTHTNLFGFHVSFVSFVSFKLTIPHDYIFSSCNMLASTTKAFFHRPQASKKGILHQLATAGTAQAKPKVH